MTTKGNFKRAYFTILLLNVTCTVFAGYDYLCSVGSIYQIPCQQLQEAHKISEGVFQKTRYTPVADDAPYLIEPKTHRIWFTSPTSPQEIPVDRLVFYEKSLQFYAGKPFEHHFWCNDKALIPHSIATIQNFTAPVTIHEIGELKDKFYTWHLFQKLLGNNLFAFAADLAKQEILVHEGGLCADIGAEQLHDLDPYFKKYIRIHPISRWGFDKHILAAQKNSPFFKRSLQLIIPLMGDVASKRIHIPSSATHWFFKTDMWRLLMKLEKEQLPAIGYLYDGENYQWHGLKSWFQQASQVSVWYINNTLACDSCLESHHNLIEEIFLSKRNESEYCPVETHICEIAYHFNISTSTLARYPINHHWNDPAEEEKVIQKKRLSTPSDRSYIIPPKTHRMWLTSTQHPREVPADRLEYYRKSLQFYIGKPFEHHFWCNGVHLIPQTISAIKKFNVPVIIHDIHEVLDRFIYKTAFNTLMQDNMFTFASDIARQEILVLEGGLYADIGLEQLRDIEWTFRRYQQVLPIRGSWIDNHFMSAPKGSSFFSKNLNLLRSFMNSPIANAIPQKKLYFFFGATTWQILAAKERMPFLSEDFFYEGIDYRYHGLATWWEQGQSLTLPYFFQSTNEVSI